MTAVSMTSTVALARPDSFATPAELPMALRASSTSVERAVSRVVQAARRDGGLFTPEAASRLAAAPRGRDDGRDDGRDPAERARGALALRMTAAAAADGPSAGSQVEGTAAWFREAAAELDASGREPPTLAEGIPAEVQSLLFQVGGDPLLLLALLEAHRGSSQRQQGEIEIASAHERAQNLGLKRQLAIKKAIKRAQRRARMPRWLLKTVKAVAMVATTVAAAFSGGVLAGLAIAGAVLMLTAKHVGDLAQSLGMSAGAAKWLERGLQLVGAALMVASGQVGGASAAAGAGVGASGAASGAAGAASGAASGAAGAASGAAGAASGVAGAASGAAGAASGVAGAASGAASAASASAQAAMRTVARVLETVNGLLSATHSAENAVLGYRAAGAQREADSAELSFAASQSRLEHTVEILRDGLRSMQRTLNCDADMLRLRDQTRQAILNQSL